MSSNHWLNILSRSRSTLGHLVQWVVSYDRPISTVLPGCLCPHKIVHITSLHHPWQSILIRMGREIRVLEWAERAP
jgi:hypothetical protein